VHCGRTPYDPLRLCWDKSTGTEPVMADVVAVALKWDLALLKIRGDRHDWPCLSLASIEKAQAGDKVLVLGWPDPETFKRAALIAWYVMLRRNGAAMVEIRRALEADPSDGVANAFAFRIYQSEGDVERAAEHLERALADPGSRALAVFSLGRADRAGPDRERPQDRGGGDPPAPGTSRRLHHRRTRPHAQGPLRRGPRTLPGGRSGHRRAVCRGGDDAGDRAHDPVDRSESRQRPAASDIPGGVSLAKGPERGARRGQEVPWRKRAKGREFVLVLGALQPPEAPLFGGLAPPIIHGRLRGAGVGL